MVSSTRTDRSSAALDGHWAAVAPINGMMTGDRTCPLLGNKIHLHNVGKQKEAVVVLWRTSFADNMADMKAGSRVPGKDKKG